jgi:hypothetical protein
MLESDLMKESFIRKWHRSLGILLALFIILQTGSGFLISLGELSVPHSHTQDDNNASSHGNNEGESLWQEALEFIHHGAGTAGSLYRILIGIGLLWMAVSGSMIFFKIKARSKKGQPVSSH